MQSPRHRRASRSECAGGTRTLSTAGLVRLTALVAVGGIGVTGLASLPGAGQPKSVVAVRSALVVDRHAGQPRPPFLAPSEAGAAERRTTQQAVTPRVTVPQANLAPLSTAAREHSAPASRHGRGPAKPAGPWLPSGTGMWIYEWDHSAGGSASAIVARARRVGLSTLYVRTGSSHDGFTGGAALSRLLPATRGTDVHVVAWDFPTLWHPRRDARRLAAAARFGRSGSAPHVAAVAPDIETPAEGTYNAAWRVRTYLTALRRHLPDGVAILGTVPWPSRYRIADYPYRTVAPRVDAFVPMAYWYNNPPKLVTERSIAYLRRFHLPVLPVGQGYDGKLDVPSLHHNHLAREVPRFLKTAKQHGARAVSLWSWQAAPHSAWRALGKAQRMFRPSR